MKQAGSGGNPCIAQHEPKKDQTGFWCVFISPGSPTLPGHSSGNSRPQSSLLAGPLWIDPVTMSGISVRELISTFRRRKKEEKKSAGGGMNGRTFSPNPRKREKSHPHQPGIACWYERRTRDRKVSSSNPGRSGGRIFFSRVTFVC